MILQTESIGSLSDVDLTGVVDNKILKWSGGTFVIADDQEGSSAVWGGITGTLSDQTDLQAALDAKENAFSKNTAFNKNFGTIAGSVCDGSDSRLSDTRDPNPHTHVKADITDFSDSDYATAAQGALADTAAQPGDNVSIFVNDAGYIDTLVGIGGYTESYTAAATIDATAYNVHKSTLTGNITFAFNSVPNDYYSCNFELLSDGTSIITWPANVSWVGNNPPVLPASGETLLVTLSTTDNGTNWTGIHSVGGEGGGEAVWGGITGTLSDQTDLQAELDGKEDIFTKNTAFNKDFGTIAGSVCEGDDSRLTNSRTPTAHTHVKADITDFSDGDYATAAQGATADSAAQPGDNVSIFVNDQGYLTTVSGYSISAVATEPTSTGTDSLAIGSGADAGGQGGVSIGKDSSASGLYGVAIGQSALANNSRGVAIGYSTTVGNYSIAHGYDSTGNGSYSIAFGYRASTSFDHGIAIGHNVIVADANDIRIGEGDATSGLNGQLINYQGSSGKFRLVDTDNNQAQYLLPNYATASLPANGESGSLVYDSDVAGLKYHDGAAWKEIGGGVDEAPEDGASYARKDAAWVSTINQVFDDKSPSLGGSLETSDNAIIFTADQIGVSIISTTSLDNSTTWETQQSGPFNFLSQGLITIGNDTNDIKINTTNVRINDLVYPDTDGTNGQVLTTDGAGNLTFQDSSGGGGSLIEIGGYTEKTSTDAAIDASVVNYATLPDSTITFTNVPVGAYSCTIVCTGTTYTWPSRVSWQNGEAPTLSEEASDIIIFTTVDQGVNWFGSYSQGYYPITDAYLAGSDFYGQSGSGNWNGVPTFTLADSSGNVDKMAVGSSYTMKLMSNGDVYGVGSNNNGQITGDGTISNVIQDWTLVHTGVIDIACGYNHTLLLMANGDVKAFGENTQGQVTGDADTTSPQATAIVVDTGCVAVYSAARQSFVKKTNNDLYGFGENNRGEITGDGLVNTPVAKVLVDSNVDKVGTGTDHTLLLMNNGDVKGFGYNAWGQVRGDGDVTTPKASAVIETGATDVYGGYGHSVILMSNGDVKAFGLNQYSQARGDGDVTSPSPASAVIDSGISKIATTGYSTYLLTSTNQLKAFGQNSYGQVTNDGTWGTDKPVSTIIETDVTDVYPNTTSNKYFIKKSNSDIMAIGYNNLSSLGIGVSLTLATELWVENPKAIAVGNTMLYVTQDGNVYAAGLNSRGSARGDGSEDSPKLDYALIETNAVDVFFCGSITFIKMENGDLKGFGYNNYGQCLGNGDVTSPILTSQELDDSDIIYVDGHGNHTIMLASNGDVWGSGLNSYGQVLGNGDVTSPQSTRVKIETGAKAIACGAGHTVILMENGDVKAFGQNNHGQVLGNGDVTSPQSTSAVIETGAKAIACGAGHTVILMENGDVKAFGQNNYGQVLGNGDVTSPQSTSAVIETGAKAIACGTYHTYILMENGDLKAFGYNNYSEVTLDGDNSESPVPLSAVVETDVKWIEAKNNNVVIGK